MKRKQCKEVQEKLKAAARNVGTKRIAQNSLEEKTNEAWEELTEEKFQRKGQ